MAECKLSTELLKPDCFSGEAGGMDGDVILFNFEDYQQIIKTVNPTTGNITNLSFPVGSGLRGYLFEVNRKSVKPSVTPVVSENQSGFTHTLQFFISSLSQELKDDFAKMLANNNVVALVKTKNQNAQWEEYGGTVGLEMSGITYAPGAQETSGGFTPILTTPTDATIEKRLPVNVNSEVDRATTDAFVEALLSPA